MYPPDFCRHVTVKILNSYKVHRKIGHIYAAYADNFFLPFNLLAANTFLPPAVLILALNP